MIKRFKFIFLFLLMMATPAFAGSIINNPMFQSIDANGDPRVGSKLYSYVVGTSTEKLLYSDADCSTPLTNPYILTGEDEIYGCGHYKLVLKTSADVTVWTHPDYAGGGPGTSSSYYYPNSGAADHGVTGDSDTIKYNVDTIGGTDAATQYFRHDGGSSETTYTLTTSETIPANQVFEFEQGAIIDGAGTLTFAGGPKQIKASDTQKIFGSSITVVFSSAKGKRSVAWWGADGSGTETTELEACSGSVSGGIVVIPFTSFTVAASASDYVDCNGAIVEGNNTTVVGYLGDYEAVKGIKFNNDDGENNYDLDQAIHPVIKRDKEKKLLRRVGTNEYSMSVYSGKGRYAHVTLENNVTTTTSSLALTSSDTTAWRVTAISNPVEVFTGYTTKSSSSGVWTATDFVEIGESYDTGSLYSYERCTGSADYAEYTITVPTDGFFSVSFVRRSDSSDDVDIQLDGANIETAFDTTNGTDDYCTLIYHTTPGSHVIKVINQTAGSDAVRILGINFAKLKDQRIDVSLDTSGIYTYDTGFSDPIASASENDFAIYDDDADKWGNGYHGGQSSISTTWFADGTSQSLSTGDMIVCDDLEVTQSYTIDWSGSGGGDLDATSEYIMVFGGYYYKYAVTGDMNARSFYTTLVGVNDAFDELIMPRYYDLSALSDGNYVLKKGNYVEYQQSTSKQRVIIEHTQFISDGNTYSGPFVFMSTASGYHKYYNSIVANGYKTISTLSGINLIQVN